jgi:hypothetical protein
MAGLTVMNRCVESQRESQPSCAMAARSYIESVKRIYRMAAIFFGRPQMTLRIAVIVVLDDGGLEDLVVGHAAMAEAAPW